MPIEAKVHEQLREFLRSERQTPTLPLSPQWPHHLTMARLVARALRLGRSALIQTGLPPTIAARHRLSYLMSVLMWPGPVILVIPERWHQQLLDVEIPRLQDWNATTKPVVSSDRIDEENFSGLVVAAPEVWLRDRLFGGNRFSQNIPTIIDGVDDLKEWAFQQLTVALHPEDWNRLGQDLPDWSDTIYNYRAKLAKALFQHPANPYQCHLLDNDELGIIRELQQQISERQLPAAWQRFPQAQTISNWMFWSQLDRAYGYFSLFAAPVELASSLQSVWQQQPVVLIGGSLEPDTQAPLFRQQIGLPDVTCVKFSPDRHHEPIQLYMRDGLPLPNTPRFRHALYGEIQHLLAWQSEADSGLAVIVVGDIPLKKQVGSALAAEYGSRVHLESTACGDRDILVTGWSFWRHHQEVLPTPNLLAIATLPFPSLENPLVAGRVAYYKRQRQNWFRLYLLPEALQELQRAIAPVRSVQGVVALLDNRVLHRSYGTQVLSALSPHARLHDLLPPNG
ncbi:helicase C-terminal domain-containing protein [Geitlerinema sp. PCC 9228]|uniref:helicase C-terminal domain-containing protein n=1 Tax=Geitlerinema sp. PCC 9228 TaxID=111611 RepID=UPI000AD8E085|nr:helicase C-terminal domain-containing protein [Geitlerinema sp. PCC 9228]